jgi:hypothetical protein
MEFINSLKRKYSEEIIEIKNDIMKEIKKNEK